METSTNPVLTSGTLTNNRIKVIDVLRGFALLGIIINHIDMNFLAGMPPPENLNFNIQSSTDQVFNQYNLYLTFGKFFTIFSFLFGLSFAIQLQSALKKGISFSGRFLWRLVILFIIGYVHNLFFSGDILVIYAFLGFLLVLFQNLSSKIILIVSALLILNVPLTCFRLIELNSPPPTAEQLESQQVFMAQLGETATQEYNIKASGNLEELVAMNFGSGLANKLFFQIFTGRLWITLGLFLLGFYAGRKKIFENNPANKKLFRRVLIFSFIVALFSTSISIMYGKVWGPISSWWDFMGITAFDFHQASLSAFYVSGIVLLYWETQAARILHNLAPVGQMGLTTYLTQTIFGISIFYGVGLGMLGSMGSATAIGIGILFFVVQIIASKLWLLYFRMGPVEWFWRAATYFKLPPFRKSSGGGVIPAAS
ncbi:DUF418 domain-containing protein [soil metagenome]